MLTYDEAYALLQEYNEGEFHLHHGKVVGDVMRWYAEQLGYGDEADFSWFRAPERMTFNGYLSVLVRRRPNCKEPIVVEASGSSLSGKCSF